MVTMAEVGRLAGVSVATVSHVLNGTRAVRPETAARVLAAIERTGYMPNTLARGLARARTQSIGLALSAVSNPYFMEVVTAIEAATWSTTAPPLAGGYSDTRSSSASAR